MKIAMFTNLYWPMSGGVTISIDRFAKRFRRRKHNVLIVAPRFPEPYKDDNNTYRVHALHSDNLSEFPVALPPGPALRRRLAEFEPDIIHTHHPFLLGDAAARAAQQLDVPLVYTHHTLYEHYTHYTPLSGDVMKHFVVRLATGFTRFCDYVVAPSQSVRTMLQDRGVTAPIEVVPTGIDADAYTHGDRRGARKAFGLPSRAFVFGHVGRLAAEKNLELLTRASVRALKQAPDAFMLIIGSGDLQPWMRDQFDEADLDKRVLFAGHLNGKTLVNAYHAMNAFVFSSISETQGMVLMEAMAAGAPVIAIDAPGVRDIVRDGRNGLLAAGGNEQSLSEAMVRFSQFSSDRRRNMRRSAQRTGARYDMGSCADALLDVYRQSLRQPRRPAHVSNSEWNDVTDSICREWAIWANRLRSLGDAIGEAEQNALRKRKSNPDHRKRRNS